MNRPGWTILTAALAVSLSPVGARGQGLQDSPRLAWQMCKDLEEVRQIFPHPSEPLTAWAATASGLRKTSDGGVTFLAVESASVQKVGPVTDLACCPADENRLLLGTEGGLYLSGDGGATWTVLDPEGRQLASRRIHAVRFSDTDPSWRTLLVTHGKAAPGMSVSRDLGKTWAVMGQDRFLGRFVQSGDTFVAAGSMLETEGRVWGIHRSGFDGWRWEECNRGLPVGEPAVPVLRPDHFYFSTLDGRILGSSNDGMTWYPITESQSARWVSLFFTFGRADNVEVLAAYDPYSRGVVLSSQRMRTGTQRAENKDLYVGSFVRSGAACRSNCNGTIYYVALNNALWIGRRAPTNPTGPMVAQARCLPATLWVGATDLQSADAAIHQRVAEVAAEAATPAAVTDIAQAVRTYNERKGEMVVTVQAWVRHPQGLKAIKIVTADATVLGGRPDAELFDDGKHNDGAPGDGLYAASIPFLPTHFGNLPERDRRWPLPGLTALTVTAVDTGGVSDSWSAVASVQRRPAAVGLHPLAMGYRFSASIEDGPVQFRDDNRQAMTEGRSALSYTVTAAGAWRAGRISGSGVNIYGCDKLVFYVKGQPSQDLYVALVDRFQVGEDVVDEPHFSRPVHLISGGYLKAITPEYQKVEIPVGALLPKGTLFLPRHAAGIALGATAEGKPGQYYIGWAYMAP